MLPFLFGARVAFPDLAPVLAPAACPLPVAAAFWAEAGGVTVLFLTAPPGGLGVAVEVLGVVEPAPAALVDVPVFVPDAPEVTVVPVLGDVVPVLVVVAPVVPVVPVLVVVAPVVPVLVVVAPVAPVLVVVVPVVPVLEAPVFPAPPPLPVAGLPVAGVVAV